MKLPIWILVVGAALVASDASADSTSVWNGQVRLGGVYKDETVDLSAHTRMDVARVTLE